MEMKMIESVYKRDYGDPDQIIQMKKKQLKSDLERKISVFDRSQQCKCKGHRCLPVESRIDFSTIRQAKDETISERKVLRPCWRMKIINRCRSDNEGIFKLMAASNHDKLSESFVDATKETAAGASKDVRLKPLRCNRRFLSITANIYLHNRSTQRLSARIARTMTATKLGCSSFLT